MPDDVPAKGPKLDTKKKIMIGAGALALIGFLWWRQRSSAAAAAAAAAPAADTGSADSGTDLSGFGTDASLSDEGDLGYDTSGIGGDYGYGSALSGISSNADWYAAALQAAENVGYDPATAATALSAYLASQPLTSQQQQIVQVGLAAAGTPPMGIYSIIPEPTGTTTTGTTGTTTTTTTPTPPAAAKTPTGLRVTSLTSNGFTVGWDGQSTASGYYMYVNGHKSPKLYGTLWDVNTGNIGIPITPSTKYAVTITAVNAAGTESAHSATLNVTTKAAAKTK